MSLPEICVVCKGTEDVKETSVDKFNRMLQFSEQWSKIEQYNELHENLLILQEKPGTTVFHHVKCYGNVTHKDHLKRDTKKYLATKNNNQSASCSTLCFVCQTDDPQTHVSKATNVKKGQEIFNIINECSEDIKKRLASIKSASDVIHNKLAYHNRCLRNKVRTIETPSIGECSSSSAGTQLKVEKKLLDYITLQIDSLQTIDMKQVEVIYLKYLKEEQIDTPLQTDIRKYLKTIISSDVNLMPRIDFFHHAPRKPAVIASKTLVARLVCEKHFNGSDDDKYTVNKAFKLVRKELGKLDDWSFDGIFEKYKTPPLLSSLMYGIIAGNRTVSEKKSNELTLISNNISQYICSNYKSDRQMSYQSQNDRGFEKIRVTPLSFGTALICYKNNRTRTEIDVFSKLGLSVTYDKFQRMITGIALSIVKEGTKIGLGAFLPPCIKKGIRPIFAADNIDVGSDRGSFHGADLMVAQDQVESEDHESLFPNIAFQTSQQSRSFPLSIKYEIDENVDITEETDATFLPKERVEQYSEIFKDFQEHNTVWLLLTGTYLKTISQTSNDTAFREENDSFVIEDELEATISSEKTMDSKTLSWSAFHSVLSASPTAMTKIAIVAPLWTKSPTLVPILMDILRKAMKITVLTVGEGKRTIVTLDGDLYNQAVKLKNYKDNLIIRLGSLHTVIAALKCLGKYIEDSGIDAAWEASGIYGKATIRQIIEGRHIYRGIEAHSVTLICLHQLYSQYIFTKDEMKNIDQIVSNITYSKGCDEDTFISNVSHVQELLKKAKVFENLSDPKVSMNGTAAFLRNYMNQVFNLLNYIGATRTKNWNQHLSATEDMCKYFFAHDQYKYAQWTAKYLADMLELKTVDKESWDFLEKHFSVSKNKVPFTSIDPDHGIEHEQRKMKVKGGIIGATNNESALERYALTAPIFYQMEESYLRCSAKPTNVSESVHHELIGSDFDKKLQKASLLLKALAREGNPFGFEDLTNLMNFSVPNSKIVKDIINRDTLGQKAFDDFRKKRMSSESTIPFWDPFKKIMLKMFSDTEIVIKKLNISTTLKVEKQLYARLLFLSTSRPDLCPKTIIGDYEFSNIPASNFQPNGKLIVLKSNDSLLSVIKTKQVHKYSPTYVQSKDATLIMHGMCLLDELKTNKTIKTVQDLANVFITELKKISESYSEIRLIFPQYMENSVKESSVEIRLELKKAPIHFHINSATPIKNLEQFLNHIKTRSELTKFLGDAVLKDFKYSKKNVLVAYHNKFLANVSMSDIVSSAELFQVDHTLEGAEQLILLNAVDIAKKDANRKCCVYAKDDTTLVLLTSFYEIIPLATLFCNEEIGAIYHTFGKTKAKALLGWHAFKGTEITGSFSGKGNAKQFGAFMKSDSNILQAFSAFGDDTINPSNLMSEMERYICLLYGQNMDTKIEELRYNMSVPDGKDSSKLPPTRGTLLPHVFRAFWLTMMWKRSIQISPLPLPSPTDFYWYLDESNKYHPIMCTKQAAPDTLQNYIRCKCKSKTDTCNKLSCSCLSNGMLCSDLCRCVETCQLRPAEKNSLNADDDLL